MQLKRYLLAAMSTLALALCAPGALADNGSAGESTAVAPPENLVTPDSLTYGTAATFPPFEYFEPGEGLAGFDIEMIRQLAEYMGLEVEVLNIDFDGLIPALRGGRIDIVNSAMYIKPARENQVDFVPYMLIGESIVVRQGSSLDINELPEDLSGLNVAVTRGAIGEVYMRQFNKELEAMGLPPMNIMTFPTNQDALLAVRSGRADAFDTAIPGAAYLNEKQPGQYKVAATFDLGTKIGIATREGDEDMQRAMRQALERFVEEGAYQRLLKKYGFPPEVNYFAQKGDATASKAGE